MKKFGKVCEILEAFGGHCDRARLECYDGLICGEHVLIADDLTDERAAWTLGHEIGHLLMHSGSLIDHRDSRAEAEADYIADRIMELITDICPWDAASAAVWVAAEAHLLKSERGGRLSVP